MNTLNKMENENKQMGSTSTKVGIILAVILIIAVCVSYIFDLQTEISKQKEIIQADKLVLLNQTNTIAVLNDYVTMKVK